MLSVEKRNLEEAGWVYRALKKQKRVAKFFFKTIFQKRHPAPNVRAVPYGSLGN